MISMTSSDKSAKRKSAEGAWLAETMSRYKLIPVLLIIFYFLCDILPVLISYNRFEEIYYYAEECVLESGGLNIPLAVISGIIAAVAVLSYLHNTAAVTEVHSRPLTRVQLFRASFVSGLIMILVPIILTGAFYLCVQGASFSPNAGNEVMYSGYIADQQTVKVEDVLNFNSIAVWAGKMMILSVFAFCVSCLAGILACTGIIQTLLSLLLLALPNTLYFIWNGYTDAFMLGWHNMRDYSSYLSPFVYVLNNGFDEGKFSPVLSLYLIGAGLIAAAAAMIYRRLKLENENRSIAVDYVAEALVIILSFISVSIGLLIAHSIRAIANSIPAMLLVVILATAVFFPIYCMIADRSFRVLNRKNGITLAVYGMLMIIVFAFTIFDITGYEKRIPASDDIASVTLECSDESFISDRYVLKNEESIEKVRALHTAVVKADIESEDPVYESCFGPYTLHYTLKNGNVLVREYDCIPKSAVESLSNLYNDTGIRKADGDAVNLLKGNTKRVTISVEAADGSFEEYIVPSKLYGELTDAMSADIKDRNGESAVINGDAVNVSIIVNISILALEDDEEISSEKEVYFSDIDRNIRAFLKAHSELVQVESEY